MGCPVSIPQREGPIIIPTVSLMYLIVRTIIRTVHVTENSRSDHRMIHGGIELNQVIRIIAVHFNLRQFFVPASDSLRMITVEIVDRHFCLKVLCRTFHAHTRNSRIHQNLFVLFRIEIETGYIGCTDTAFILRHNRRCIHMVSNKRFGETGLEIDMLVGRPSL